MITIGDRAVAGVDYGDDFGEEDLLELVVGEGPASPAASSRGSGGWSRRSASSPAAPAARQIENRTAATVVHHHDHRLGLAGCDQVVEDEVHSTLAPPAGLVLAGAMLQVEHRIALRAAGVIPRRRVDERPPPGVLDF